MSEELDETVWKEKEVAGMVPLEAEGNELPSPQAKAIPGKMNNKAVK